MDPVRFSIDRPVTVAVGVLLVVLFGLISLTTIPIQLTPTIETTVVSVETRWEGASPQEIEREVVREQEEKLKNIQSLKRMTSLCELGQGEITLEFLQGTPEGEALREVSDKLREVREYPENVDEPVVRATNPADRDYIAWVVVESTDPTFDVRRLHDFFEERVKPELERVPGIAEVNVLGGWEREVHVLVDPMKLAQRGVTPTALADALRNQNRNASAGQIAEGKHDVRVRSVGRYESLEQIELTMLSQPGRPVVRVRDVADVALGFKEPNRVVRNKGRTVLALNAQRRVGSNVIEVMEGFQAALAGVQENVLPAEAKRLNLNGDINLEQVYDQTIYIDQAVNLVLGNLVWAAVMTVVVLLIFLRSMRSTLVVALAIPVSVIGTFLAMAALGRTINVISLAGLAFAIGVVVDNAIVVLENIDRHRRLGRTGREAAYTATREVWGAILASTLTTVAVFIPVLTVQEEAGQLFRDISLAICAAVLLSLIVAVTVIPAAASRWLRGSKQRRAPVSDAPKKRAGRIYEAAAGVGTWYARFLEGIMGTRMRRTLVITGIAGLAIFGAFALVPPASYLPQGNRNMVFAMMFSPPGYNLEQQVATGLGLEARIGPYWEARGNPEAAAKLPAIEAFDPATGGTKTVQPPPLYNFFFVALPDMMFMGGISEDPRNVGPVEDLFNVAINEQPGLMGFARQMPLFRTASFGSGDAVELEIAGPDLNEVNAAASLLFGRIMGKLGSPRYVRPDPTNFDLAGPEVRVTAKRVEAADVGLTQRDINTAVQIFGDGAIFGDYLYEGQTIDLKVLTGYTSKGPMAESELPSLEGRGKGEGPDAGSESTELTAARSEDGRVNPHPRLRRDLSLEGRGAESGDAAAIGGYPLATPVGRVVPLRSVAEIDRTLAPQQILRVEEQRAVALSVQVPDEMALENIIDFIAGDIDALRAQGLIPPTVTTRLAGSAAKLKSVREAMLGEWTGPNAASLASLVRSRMFLALLVTFLLMAALFESWLYPLAIMFSVPLAMVGAFAGLRLVHTFVPSQQLDVLTMLGFVILVGTVVNNAILIVHQTLNILRGDADIGDKGKDMTPKAAIAEATRTRIRPIFMTAITTFVGALPLVVFPGSGAELYRGLGAVVLGGLLVSTVFTLVLVPLILSVIFDIRQRILHAAVKT